MKKSVLDLVSEIAGLKKMTKIVEQILARKTGGGYESIRLMYSKRIARELLLVCSKGLTRLSRRVSRHSVRRSRESSSVPSLHRGVYRRSYTKKVYLECVHICNPSLIEI